MTQPRPGHQHLACSTDPTWREAIEEWVRSAGSAPREYLASDPRRASLFHEGLRRFVLPDGRELELERMVILDSYEDVLEGDCDTINHWQLTQLPRRVAALLGPGPLVLVRPTLYRAEPLPAFVIAARFRFASLPSDPEPESRLTLGWLADVLPRNLGLELVERLAGVDWERGVG